MRPAGNAHWYHPDTEVHDSRDICLHPCNARPRRVAHDARVTERRVAHESCVVQRAPEVGPLPATGRASGCRVPSRLPAARCRLPAARCPLPAARCPLPSGRDPSRSTSSVDTSHPLDVTRAARPARPAPVGGARVRVARRAAQFGPRRRVVRPGRPHTARRATGTASASGRATAGHRAGGVRHPRRLRAPIPTRSTSSTRRSLPAAAAAVDDARVLVARPAAQSGPRRRVVRPDRPHVQVARP